MTGQYVMKMTRNCEQAHFSGRCLVVLIIVCLVTPTNGETVLVENDETSNDSQDQLHVADGTRSLFRVRRSNANRRWRILYRSSHSRGTPRRIRCGQVEIDPRGALCCDGIVYGRRSGSEMRCCGRVAYEVNRFACCGPEGRQTVIQRSTTMPACCDDRSNVECPSTDAGGRTAALGSVCCRVPPPGDADRRRGGWRCCVRSAGCCDGAATDTVHVPGYRPACCEPDVATAARCCARTYERVGLLPECCDRDALRPICCRRPDRSVRCCPANFGYCCGQPERSVPTPTSSAQQQQQQQPDQQSSSRNQHQSSTGDDRRAYDDQDHDRSGYDAGQRDPYDDRYPTVRMPDDGATTARDPDATTLATIPATCCFSPSSRCCRSSSGTSSQSAICCRSARCRSASFRAACCRRQNPASCRGQGSGNPRCSGQRSGANPCCVPGRASGGSGGGGAPCCTSQRGGGRAC